MKKEENKDLAYWKANAEEDYLKVPISVLRYITCLEERIEQLRIGGVINWVACKDELPKNDGDYLVCKDGFVFDAGYSVEHKHFHDYEVTLHENVTYWAELPKPPCL